MTPKLVIAFAVATFFSPIAATSGMAQTVAEVDTSLDQLFGEHVRYRQFFDDLKKAVAAGDKEKIAGMVYYPFGARINGKVVKIRDAAHFAAAYDKIFTEKVKKAVTNQTYETVFANWQGVMFGDGEVWFSGVGNKNLIKITAVND